MTHYTYYCPNCRRYWYYAEFDDYGTDVRSVFTSEPIIVAPVPNKLCDECEPKPD